MLSNDIFVGQAENLKKLLIICIVYQLFHKGNNLKHKLNKKWKITFLIHFFFYLIGPTKQFRSHKKDYS